MWLSTQDRKRQKVFYMEEKIFAISAKEVTIEVVDEATGKTYRRTLPIDYYWTAVFPSWSFTRPGVCSVCRT